MSGAIGVLPGKTELAPGGIEPEAKQMMENIGEVLKANGLTFDDVFKCTCHARRYVQMGRIQQDLRDVFQTGIFTRALRAWR